MVKLGARWLSAGAFVIGTALLPGCGDDMASPTGPSPIDPQNQESNANNANPVLKVKDAPAPSTPSRQDEIDDRQPELVASNATSFLPDVVLEHEFAVHLDTVSSNPTAVDSGFGTRAGPNSTYQVAEKLLLGERYEWRVRATYPDPVTNKNTFSDWSQPAKFSIAPVVFGKPPRLVSPARGNSVSRRPTFLVRQGEVDAADDVQVQVEIHVAPERNQLADAPIVEATDAVAGQEVAIELDDDLAIGETYYWQARAVARQGSSAFEGRWSKIESFETNVQSLGVPEPTAPVSGAEVSTRPTFTVRNGMIEGNGVGSVTIRVEVARDRDQDGVADDAYASAVEGRAPMQGGAGDETRIHLDAALRVGTSYVWRAQAVALQASPGPLRSVWSSNATFATRESGSYPLGPVKNPPPNLRHVVQRVADAHPDAVRRAIEGSFTSLPNGPNDPRYELLRLVVEALREADGGRWGTTYWTHPPHADNWSRERLAYYLGNGDPVNSTNIRVIEFLLFANGSIFWWDATDHLRTDYPNATGHWRHPPGYRAP